MAKRFGMRGRLCLLALAALAPIAFSLAASVSEAAVSPSGKRVALVIGNGAYQSAIRLDNAVFDAKAVAESFRKLGFQVVDGYDLDIDQMRSKVSEFSAALSDSKSAVIYYAGHGISVDEENYLVPTDIILKSTALDGPPGQHSPFTQAFLAHLFDPGVTIDTVMSRVRNDVWEKTGHNQLPWATRSLMGE